MKSYIYFLLLLAFGLIISRSFVLPGFIPSHDGECQIIKLWQFDKSIREGNLLPVWAPDLNKGYGIPIFGFFYLLPNYLGEAFHLLGFSLIDSFKLTLALSEILSGIFFFLWLKVFFKKEIAFIGSILYLLAPYHLVDLYVRGSVGESLALALCPLLLYFISIWIKRQQDKKIFFFTASTLALLLLSHNILGVFLSTFALIYGLVLFFFEKKKLSWYYFLIFFAGFSLSVFFWLPILFENSFVIGLDIINYQDHFPSFFQLLFPSWGTGFSVPGIMDGMSFQVGLVHWVTVFFALIVFFYKKRDYLLLFFLTTFFILIFLMLESSQKIWQMISIMSYFQYPWRLLSLVIVISSFLVGYLRYLRYHKFLYVVIFLLTFFCYFSYTRPVVYQSRNDDFYLKNPDWAGGTATYGNTFQITGFNNVKPFSKKIEDTESELIILKQDLKSSFYRLETESSHQSTLKINTAYFPGWVVKIDGKKGAFSHDNGLININIPSGKHSIIVNFEGSLVRKLAGSLSLMSLIILAIICFIPKKYENWS